MKRRTLVVTAGSGLGATVAGCLGDGPNDEGDPGNDGGNGSDENETDDPGNGSDGPPTNESEDLPDEGNDSDGSGNDDPDGEADGSGYTVTLKDSPVEVDGEFATLRVELIDAHVEPGSPAALEATLTNTSEETIVVASGAPSPFGVLQAQREDGGESITLWNDAYEESSHVGTDGKDVGDIEDIALAEEFEADESITQTFEIHEETPNLEPGTYETSITVRIESEDSDEVEGLEVDLSLSIEEGTDGPNGEGDGGNGDETSEEPRIDEPPYEIEEPEPPDDPAEDDWNEHYLGEEMPGEPSIGFETLEGVRLETLALSIEDDESDQYALDLIESREGLEDRFDLDRMGGEDRERVEAVGFDEQVVVVVESGFGSGSVHHRWKRVEEREGEVHLHGYYTQPYIQENDYGPRQSALAIERPAEATEMARASLTVSPDRRAHFDSTEGVVAVEDGN